MSVLVFAVSEAPLLAKVVGACLAGLLPGMLSGRLRADGESIAVPYLIACTGATVWLHQVVDADPGVLAIGLGLIVGFFLFVIAPSRRASLWAACVVTLLSFGALGCVAYLRMPPVEMRRAIARIQGRGGVVQQSDGPGITYRDPWSVDFAGNSRLDDDRLLELAADLRKLPKLCLRLSDCRVGDQGLAALGQTENLAWLSLDGTQVTDAGLGHLERVPRLERLDLLRTRVSSEGVERLRQTLPNCEIVWKPPTKGERHSRPMPDLLR